MPSLHLSRCITGAPMLPSITPTSPSRAPDNSSPRPLAKLISRHYISLMAEFDYQAPAELYIGHARRRSGRPLKYLRFDSTSEAISYAMESLSAEEFAGAAIETEHLRLTSSEILSVYEAADFPGRNERAPRI